MDITDLEYFKIIAESGSLTKAARSSTSLSRL